MGRFLAAPISFALQKGEIFLVQGKNGCGKSSFLRLLAGLLPPMGGAFFWQGQEISPESPQHRRKVAYLGHKLALIPHLTVFEQLQQGIRLCESVAGKSFLIEKLDAFDLKELAAVPLQFLSQGQQQRVALCRVILSQRPLWLLDEPTNNLDKKAQKTLYQEIDHHTQNGGLVALASHEAAPFTTQQTIIF